MRAAPYMVAVLRLECRMPLYAGDRGYLLAYIGKQVCRIVAKSSASGVSRGLVIPVLLLVRVVEIHTANDVAINESLLSR